jgi:hypothetical protein
MSRRLALLGVLVAIAGGHAEAQERPPLLPARDAIVEYRAGGRPGSSALPVRAHFSGDKIRAEAENMRGYVIVDRDADRAMLVMEQPRAFVEVPLRSGLTRDYLLDDNMAYTRRGKDRVAGIPCTIWDVQAPQGRTATVCISADGLILRGAGHDPRYGDGSIEAISVTYGPQAAGLFAAPPGYQRLAVPLISGLTGARTAR